MKNLLKVMPIVVVIVAIVIVVVVHINSEEKPNNEHIPAAALGSDSEIQQTNPVESEEDPSQTTEESTGEYLPYESGVEEEPDIIDNGDGGEDYSKGDLYPYLTVDAANTVARVVTPEHMQMYEYLANSVGEYAEETSLEYVEYKQLSTGMYVLVLKDTNRYYSLYTDGNNYEFSQIHKDYYKGEE